jgi:hypothetical protein
MNNQVLAMAFSRQAWITKFRQRLGGLLREYTKTYMTNRLGLADCWEKETKKLADKLSQLMNQQLVKKKGSWDTHTAAAEAVLEVFGDQYKCKEALNDFRDYDKDGIYSADDIKNVFQSYSKDPPDSEDLVLEIIEKYLSPQDRDKILVAIQRQLG